MCAAAREGVARARRRAARTLVAHHAPRILAHVRQPLAAVLELVAKTYRIIRQNLAWAIGYNLLALPLAAAGFIPPWASALGMSASSLLVVLNAMRLNRGASSPQTGSGRIATTQDHAPRQPGSEAESWT